MFGQDQNGYDAEMGTAENTFSVIFKGMRVSSSFHRTRRDAYFRERGSQGLRS